VRAHGREVEGSAADELPDLQGGGQVEHERAGDRQLLALDPLVGQGEVVADADAEHGGAAQAQRVHTGQGGVGGRGVGDDIQQQVGPGVGVREDDVAAPAAVPGHRHRPHPGIQPLQRGQRLAGAAAPYWPTIDATSRLPYDGNQTVATQWRLDMAFPDRIERTVEIAHPPNKVWAALTTAEGLGTWFGNEATIDLRLGGAAQLKWTEGFTQNLRVERVEEPTVFGFTWQIYGLPEDDPRRTYVEFTLEPIGAGTRLTVVETGFAQLPDDDFHKAFDGNTKGWAHELGELVDYLDAA
jgi:uncharacterized protein YndB with AHSA1/START domain